MIGSPRVLRIGAPPSISAFDECLQLFGGYGYMQEFPIARAWADNRYARIAGGSSEIMNEIIGRGPTGTR